MLRLNCFFKANEGEFDKALQAAKTLVGKSLQHEGVIAYDVFTSATRPDVFMNCETWASQEALDKHAATPEFKENVPVMESCGLFKIEKFEF